MVITQIHSGLGNQMFQYAAGLALAKHLKVQCKLDITWFEHAASAQTPNPFQLDVFPKIRLDVASKSEIDALIRPPSDGILNRINHKINRNRPIHKQWAFVEPHFHFYKDFNLAKSPVFITGYWQCEKYFLPIADEIRNTFSIEILESDINFKIAEAINNSQAISMHVRRGDMVKNPEVAEKHGSCNLEYYKNAMSFIEKEVQTPTYFIFSDDKDFVKEIFAHKPNVVIIENIKQDYEELILMSKCNHNIIANSSFSWWGAWLNDNETQIVIAPKKWFSDPTMQQQTMDLLPDSWIKI